jgi:hypothetical protein
MDSPRYTVIVPVRRYRADEPVLASLRETLPAPGTAQILVAEGDHPSLQRNAALNQARGEIIVFLDNDCRLGADFWKELETVLSRPEVEIVGGPALLCPNATPLEEIFHALLTHVLIVGPVAARYGPRGGFRATTQMELILCNMAARRSIFAKIGFLSTRLYPNEENEWLDRAHAAGIGIYYLPTLQVSRPQRSGWGAMGRTLLRYGIGRTRQFQVSGWRFTPHQILPVILLFPALALVFGSRGVAVFVLLWLAVSVIVALTCDGRLRPWQRIVAGLAAPLLPFTYALGETLGWIALLFPAPASNSEIVVRDERGEICNQVGKD